MIAALTLLSTTLPALIAALVLLNTGLIQWLDNKNDIPFGLPEWARIGLLIPLLAAVSIGLVAWQNGGQFVDALLIGLFGVGPGIVLVLLGKLSEWFKSRHDRMRDTARFGNTLLLFLTVCLSVVCLTSGCGFIHRTPASPCQDMICEAVDFGDAVKIQICAGPADLQRIHSEARQLRLRRAMSDDREPTPKD